jgi:hypothetical protein
LVHGVDLNLSGCPNVDGNETWGAPGNVDQAGHATEGQLFGNLQRRGWSHIIRVGYYTCDMNADVDITPCGRVHNCLSAATTPGIDDPYYPTTSASTPQPRFGRNADIRDLAYHLAWYIYDVNTRSGTASPQPVDVVAHSMGGVIVQWMLYAEDHLSSVGQGLFPPQLWVKRVVTLSSPHAGTLGASLLEIVPIYLQASELSAQSTLINDLKFYGNDPQGTDGTRWTVLGNFPFDDLAGVDPTRVDLPPVEGISAVAIQQASKVIYFDPVNIALGPYSHGGMLYDRRQHSDDALYAFTCSAACPANSLLPAYFCTQSCQAPTLSPIVSSCPPADIYTVPPQGSSPSAAPSASAAGAPTSSTAAAPSGALPTASLAPTASSLAICLGDASGSFVAAPAAGSFDVIANALQS